MDGTLTFQFAGVTLTAILDAATRIWRVEGLADLPPGCQRVAMALVRGREAGEPLPEYSPAEGVPWRLDALAAAKRTKGVLTLPPTTATVIDGVY